MSLDDAAVSYILKDNCSLILKSSCASPNQYFLELVLLSLNSLQSSLIQFILEVETPLNLLSGIHAGDRDFLV